MKAGDLGELALRNLREAILRSSLTTLGVAVGVASLVAWLSLGIGLQALATKRLSNSGLFDTVIVTQRRNAQSMRRPPAESSPAKNARQLDDDAKNELEHLPNVVEVYSQVRFPTEVRYDGTPYSTIVAGIPASAHGNGSFDGIQGNFFSGPNADEAILQIEFAKGLIDAALQLDRQGLGRALRGEAGVAAATWRLAREQQCQRGHRRILDCAAREKAAHRRDHRNGASGGVWRIRKRAIADPSGGSLFVARGASE